MKKTNISIQKQYITNLPKQLDNYTKHNKNYHPNTIIIFIINHSIIPSIKLFQHFINLRWIQLKHNQISDNQIQQLSKFVNVEVLILDCNNIKQICCFNKFVDHPCLQLLNIFQNPVCTESNVVELVKMLKNMVKINIEDQQILKLRKKNIVLEDDNNKNRQLILSLKQQLFQLNDRSCIDINQYLKSLVKHLQDQKQLLFTFFLNLKKFKRTNQLIQYYYPILPWNLIEQWPLNNFLYDKLLENSKIIEFLDLIKSNDVKSYKWQKNVQNVMEFLLDIYYKQEINNLLNNLINKLNYENVQRMVNFIFKTCENYFIRNQINYFEFFTNIFPVEKENKDDFVYFFIKHPGKVIALKSLIIQNNSIKCQQQLQLLKSLKMINIEKKICKIEKYFQKRVSIQQKIILFFNKILKSYQIPVYYQLMNKNKLIYFSNLLIDIFTMKDYRNFTDLLLTGSVLNEQSLQKSMIILKQINECIIWLQKCEQLNKKINLVQSKQKYNFANKFFKTLIGRPEQNLKILKKYFKDFDFGKIQRLIDSNVRKQNICKLMIKFNNNFDFLIDLILSKIANIKFTEFSDYLNQIFEFEPKILDEFEKIQNFEKNVRSCIQNSQILKFLTRELKNQFSIFYIHLKLHQQQIDKLLDTKDISDIHKYFELLTIKYFKNIIEISENNLKLKNRDQIKYLKYIRSYIDQNYFKQISTIYKHLNYSYEFYKIHQINETKPKIINTTIFLGVKNIATIEQYFSFLKQNDCILQWLKQICKQQFFDLIFKKQQSIIVYNIDNFRKLQKEKICKMYFSDRMHEILVFISQNYEKQYLEFNNMDKYQINNVNDQKYFIKSLIDAFKINLNKDCIKNNINLMQYTPILITLLQKQYLTKNIIQISQIQDLSQFQSIFQSILQKQNITSQWFVQQLNIIKMQITSRNKTDQQWRIIVSQAMSLNKNRIFNSFIQNLNLFLQIKGKNTIYQLIDWNLYESYNLINHQNKYQKQLDVYIQNEMKKHMNRFSKYLVSPLQYKGQRPMLIKGIKKFENIIINLQLEQILNNISNQLGLVYPKQFNYKMINNKIHLFFTQLSRKINSHFQWIPEFDYNFCNQIKKKLGHQNFVLLQKNFCKKQTNIQKIIFIINSKVEAYDSYNQIKRIVKYRSFNPEHYFVQLINAIDILSNINIFNVDIESFCKIKYEKLPWSFFPYKDKIQIDYWKNIFQLLNEKFNFYFEVINYLESENSSDQDFTTINILYKFFEKIYQQQAAQDLINRIIELELFDIKNNYIIKKLSTFQEFLVKQQKYEDIQKQIESLQIVQNKGYIFGQKHLFCCLRILSLRGQYINRIQKINNKFRNILNDFDSECIDIQYIINNFMDATTKLQLIKNIIQILKICLIFKLKLYKIIKTSNLDDISTINLKKEFDSFKMINMNFQLIETVNQQQSIKYFGNLLQLYNNSYKYKSLAYYSQQYQTTQFFQIAIFTNLRNVQKFNWICNRNTVSKDFQ